MLNIIRNAFCRPAPVLTLKARGNRPYKITPAGGFAAPDCYVYSDSQHVASFETMKFADGGKTLMVDHFAVNASKKGQGLGEPCLRLFAEMLAEQAPQIERIAFELHRSTGTNPNLNTLANARHNLLVRIGATHIRHRAPNANTLVGGVSRNPRNFRQLVSVTNLAPGRHLHQSASSRSA